MKSPRCGEQYGERDAKLFPENLLERHVLTSRQANADLIGKVEESLVIADSGKDRSTEVAAAKARDMASLDNDTKAGDDARWTIFGLTCFFHFWARLLCQDAE